MNRRHLSAVLAVVFLAQSAVAAEPDLIRATWSQFQQEVSARKLLGRSVRVRLTGGGEVKTNLLEVTGTALVVRATRSTKQWKSEEGKSRIPKEQAAAVSFGGRLGHRGLIGALVGTGAGAGIAAATLSGTNITEGIGIILLPIAGVGLVAMGGVAGYFIGRSLGHPVPQFILTP
jgi:hypothetical protein